MRGWGEGVKAFHSDPAIKEKYLTRLHAHRVADRLIRGTGWDNGKGCAVGCTLEKYSHEAYEDELGIPRELAGLEDQIFEGLPLDDAMAWPEQFLAAITPGADLTLVWHRFAIWLLADPKHGTINFCDARGREATIGVVSLHEKVVAGDMVSWDAAGAAAWAAARAAARAAAGAAAWAAAGAAAGAAAWAAAGDAAGAAARAAAGDAAGDAARDAARDAERHWQADRLATYLTEAK